MRKHLITSYLPGQCCYHLCEYPSRHRWEPNEYDEQELDRLQDDGIGLIQLMEGWNDQLGLFGGSTFAPHNPDGFRRFVDMVHNRGMKIIPYVSSSYFESRDPHFRKEWTRGEINSGFYWKLGICSAASPGWRAHYLSNLVRILDDYGVDGIYNDDPWTFHREKQKPPWSDEVLAFDDTESDGNSADLLALVYAEVNRRRGIVKYHCGHTRRPETELKIYDYLWVGEMMKDMDRVRRECKNHPPYVVPMLDFRRGGKIEKEDDLYLNTIPYMQFPLLLGGRPLTGECGFVPGVEYASENYRNLRQFWEHYKAHPDGPHPYGLWDSVPGRVEARPTHARWLKHYLPMVEEGTWAYLEISDSDLLVKPPPENVVASAFANRDLYLVLANYGQTPVEVGTSAAYLPVGGPSSAPKDRWRLERRSLQILRRSWT